MRGNILNLGDSNGNIISTTDDLNNTTTFTYDGSNDMTSASKPLNSNTTATTSYTYNNFGEVLTLTDPLGNVTTNTYDPNGNLLTVTSPAPNSNTPASVTQFQYATNGELTQITDPKGNPTTLTYNSVGLIATITDAQNNTTSYQYDPRGNRTVVIDPINGSSHPTTFTYDIMSRLTGITYPDGSTVGFTYDIRGRRVTATDQNNKTTTYAYDDADRLISVTDPATNVTQYAYDTEDNLLSITDANNHVTQFAYNARGWVTQTTFPSTLAESYTYDLVGNLQSKTDRKNQTIQYVYDALYRLTSKTYPDQTSVEYAYDLAGKVQQVSDPTGTYGFSYDNMGRLIGTSTQYSYLPGVNFQNAYAYDAASNRTSLTAPDGSTTSYGYDTLNRLNSLANSWAGSFGFGYDALSRRTQLTRPNGVTTNYGYDSVSHLLSVLHQAGNTTLDGASYTYDPAGNRTAKTNYLNSVTSNYSYDPLYELTQVTQGSSTTETYSYDAVGNRLSSSGVPTYSYNTSNELTSNSNGSYTYDANGNTLTDAAARTFTWDFENRLTQAVVPGTNGGTTTFKYDPFGRRIQKSGPLGTTNYLYDGDNSLEEVDQNGNVLARYTQGLGVDEQLAQLRSGATSYYQADGLASITSLSNSAGTVAGTYAYDSFGNLTASTGTVANPFRYTGREFDSETGIYANRARYYDEAEGRFLSEDPIRFFGGEDFYSYVANSAPNFSDAFGLCKELEREACRRAAYSRYIGAYRRNKAESDKQANHIGIDWATESWMTYGAEKFFSGPVVIETGWVWVGKVTHKIVPVIEIYHAAHTVEEEAEVVVESYRKWRDAEMELKRDLALCDSL
jgi:RHS repeat-associated protein